MSLLNGRAPPPPSPSPAPAPDLTPAAVARLAAFLKGTSGMSLDADKQYLIESKLRPLLQRERIASFGALLDAIEGNRSSRLAEQVVHAMTINETHFFRDRIPFDTLRELLPGLALRRAQDRTLRVWSAACSSGQELYSIAIVLEELAAIFSSWRTDLVGTDLSLPILQKARAGAYSQFEVQRGLPTPLLLKYFERKGEDWIIAERIRKRTSFQHLNLLADFGHLGRFDIVFCRNVLFYFEPAIRQRILANIARALRPDGYLVLGASEALTALACGFKPSSPGSTFYVLASCGESDTASEPLRTPHAPTRAASAAKTSPSVTASGAWARSS